MCHEIVVKWTHPLITVYWTNLTPYVYIFTRVPYYELGKYYNNSCIKFIGYVIAVLCNLNVGHVCINLAMKRKNVWFHLESIDWESSCELMVIFLPFRETHLKVEILRLNEGHCKGQLFILHIPKFILFRFYI